MATEPYYITFKKQPPKTHPEISVRGYAVIEAVSIWDAAEAADKLFAGDYHLIFGGTAWDRRFGVAYPDGEQLRVTTGAATVDQQEQDAPHPPRGRILRIAAGPDLPEISNR